MLAAAGRQDHIADAAQIAEDLVVPEPDDPQARLFELLRSPGVISGLARVLPPVQLDDEARLRAIKVDDVAPARDLPLLLPAAEPAIA
jgi:hypothetical protein